MAYPLRTNQCCTYLPGLLWLCGGLRLLARSASLGSALRLEWLVCCTFGAWCLATLKYRFLLRRSVLSQLELNHKLHSCLLSRQSYLRKTFLSKRFGMLALMLVFSLLLRSVPLPLRFLITTSVGYALIKTTLSYFSQNNWKKF